MIESASPMDINTIIVNFQLSIINWVSHRARIEESRNDYEDPITHLLCPLCQPAC